MDYEVKITEVLEKNIEVKASNKEEALEKVEGFYDDETIVLDYDDLKSKEISINEKMETFYLDSIPSPTLFLDRKVFLKNNKIVIKRSCNESLGYTFIIEIEGVFFNATVEREKDIENISKITERLYNVKIKKRSK